MKGRRDRQFKYMGHRIEAGEIEAALHSLAQVIQACVHFDADDQQIIAFVKFCEKASVRVVQRELQKKLPIYMIPRKFIEMNEFAHNQNGKVDLNRVWKEYLLAKKDV